MLLTLISPDTKTGTKGHRNCRYLLTGEAGNTYPAGGIPLNGVAPNNFLTVAGHKLILGVTTFRVTCPSLFFIGQQCYFARIDHTTPTNPLVRIYEGLGQASPLVCTEVVAINLANLRLEIDVWE